MVGKPKETMRLIQHGLSMLREKSMVTLKSCVGFQ